jgi:hypothetical protein
MSGGPILELRGTEPVIRGIITSDMSAGSDLGLGGGGEAWATEIWPILMMPYRFNFDFADEKGEGIEIKTIFDLFREGFIIDRGNSARSFVWETNNGADRARWLGWPEVLEAPAG